MAQQLKTFADIVAAIREELKVSATDAVTVARIKRDVNIIYSETINTARWWWLQQQANLQVPATLSTGTCDVYHNSSKVVFSIPIGSKKENFYFSVEGTNEIYIVESHEAGEQSIKLSRRYIGPSAQGVGYKIWFDRIPLPTNCKETVEVITSIGRTPLENLGLQEYRRLTSMLPKRVGLPEAYYTGDFTEPFQTAAISGMPDLIYRISDGIVKTLVFESALPATIMSGAKLKISRSDQPGFNGEVTVASVSTTNVANDTFLYTGSEDFAEVASPDHNLVVKAIVTTTNSARYRSLFCYPSITNSRVGLTVDYQKATPPLDLDTDEPIIPIDDRIVLLYGALQRAWTRERNPEEAAKNNALYKEKVARMAGQIQDTLDKPLLRPSRLYLNAKRQSLRTRRFNFNASGFGQGQTVSAGGDSMSVLGTPDTVAIFDSNGELMGSTVVDVTELNYLDGASSNIQAQINAISTNLAGNIVNSQISASAAIARSKLASGSANAVVINNGSGVMTDSSVTSTELSFLSGVIPLTTVSIPDGQAVAAPAILIPVANTFCFIIFSLQRGSANVEGGTIVLINDGASADITIDSGALGANGTTLTADVSGGNVRILAATTLTGTAVSLKYAVIKWAA